MYIFQMFHIVILHPSKQIHNPAREHFADHGQTPDNPGADRLQTKPDVIWTYQIPLFRFEAKARRGEQELELTHSHFQPAQLSDLFNEDRVFPPSQTREDAGNHERHEMHKREPGEPCPHQLLMSAVRRKIWREGDDDLPLRREIRPEGLQYPVLVIEMLEHVMEDDKVELLS